MIMNQTTQTFLDVNAAAGELREIFAADVTTATCQCNRCGKTAPLAESYAYTTAPGLIVRCNNCETVLMRVVTGPGRAWLDLRGLQFLQLTMPLSQAIT
jgi:NAD-dependent SIR2 family protein deacetylase